jgi:hypothetical protein
VPLQWYRDELERRVLVLKLWHLSELDEVLSKAASVHKARTRLQARQARFNTLQPMLKARLEKKAGRLPTAELRAEEELLKELEEERMRREALAYGVKFSGLELLPDKKRWRPRGRSHEGAIASLVLAGHVLRCVVREMDRDVLIALGELMWPTWH